MKYTSIRTDVTTTTVKGFELHDAEPRLKRYTKGQNYKPTHLNVTYETSRGNTSARRVMILGDRILKSGDVGGRVEESISKWQQADDPSLAAFFQVVDSNAPSPK